MKIVVVEIPVQPRAPRAAAPRYLDFPLTRPEGETVAAVLDALRSSGTKFKNGTRDIERPRDVVCWWLEQVGKSK